MSKIQPVPFPEQDETELPIVLLTAEQVRELCARQPQVSIWRMVLIQSLAGVLVALFAWWVSGWQAAQSAAYGTLTVVVPAAIMARGVMGRLASVSAASFALGFWVWEAVKVILSIAMLSLARHLIDGLSWPALLAGLTITLNIHWLVTGLGSGLIFKKQD
jgi:ATP synthase protein I